MYDKNNKFIMFIPLDLETGGFNTPFIDELEKVQQGNELRPIFQIACKFLDKDLEPFVVSNPVDIMVNPDWRSQYTNKDTWDFHKRNGFDIKWVQSIKYTLTHVEEVIKDIIKQILVAEGILDVGDTIPIYDYNNSFEIVLIGKSVHFDRSFINAQMPGLGMLLSHQHADTSSIKAIMKGIKEFPTKFVEKQCTHFAMDDVDVSIEEIKVIRECLSSFLAETVEQANKLTLETIQKQMKE